MPKEVKLISTINIASWDHETNGWNIAPLEGLLTVWFSGGWKGLDKESVQAQNEQRDAFLCKLIIITKLTN